MSIMETLTKRLNFTNRHREYDERKGNKEKNARKSTRRCASKLVLTVVTVLTVLTVVTVLTVLTELTVLTVLTVVTVVTVLADLTVLTLLTECVD